MVRASYDQKPYRRILMETYGAEVVASPSLTTNYGRAVLAETPDSPGSLGMAISEAVEDAATRDDTKYALGSVLNHVLLHQTVIGQEAIEQMGMAGESPDIVIGCAGGGSNFAGLTFPFLGRNFRDGAKHRIIAVEPEAAPSLTRGVYAYDFGDTGKMAPIVKMHTLGHDFIPEPIHAGGLRYHGMSPLVSLLKEHGYIEARSVHQRASFESGVQFARAEGILPAPEPTHAIRVAIDEALAAKESGEAKVILFNLCGHGHFDLASYERYLDRVARGLRVPCREGRSRLGGPAGHLTRRGRTSPEGRGKHAATGLLVMRTPDLHRLAARVAVRGGASLPALRRVPRQGAPRARATERPPASEPARRSGPARRRSPSAASRSDAGSTARRQRQLTRTARARPPRPSTPRPRVPRGVPLAGVAAPGRAGPPIPPRPRPSRMDAYWTGERIPVGHPARPRARRTVRGDAGGRRRRPGDRSPRRPSRRSMAPRGQAAARSSSAPGSSSSRSTEPTTPAAAPS